MKHKHAKIMLECFVEGFLDENETADEMSPAEWISALVTYLEGAADPALVGEYKGLIVPITYGRVSKRYADRAKKEYVDGVK